MANTYKLTANKILSSGSTTLYTASTATTTLIKSLYISNITTGSISVGIILNKSGSNTDYYLIQSSSVPIQTSFQPISDTLVLQAGDGIKLFTDTITVEKYSCNC